MLALSYLIILGIIAIFSIGIDYAIAQTDPVITVQINGPSTFYLDESNQIIRATVEIQNYTPSDGIYFMKVTHLPTQKVMKDFEIHPIYFGNDLWGVKIAYPILESDIQVGDQMLFGEYELKIRTEYGSQTASTKFSILESIDDEPESVPTPKSTPEPTPEPTPESPTTSQSELSIDAHTNKISYEEGETILIGGKVSEILFGYAISLKVIAPNGNVILLDQVMVDSDRNFISKLNAGGSLMKDTGEYTIQLLYGNENTTKEITFFYNNEKIIVPKPAPPQIPEVTETIPKVVETIPKVEESTPKIEKSTEKNNDIMDVSVSNQKNDESDQNFIVGLLFVILVFTVIIVGIIAIKKRHKPKVETVSDEHNYDAEPKKEEPKMKWEGI